MNRTTDLTLAAVFVALTVVFILLMAYSEPFFDFAWARHHNALSWYIRPLMLLPFCFFAYKKSYAGMMFSVFALATSMMWFSAPAVPTVRAREFLRMESEYLFGTWNFAKILMALTVPLMFVLLGAAFWRKKYLYGFLVIALSGIGKMMWSVSYGGESGYVLFPAAIIGILLSGAVIFIGQKRGLL